MIMKRFVNFNGRKTIEKYTGDHDAIYIMDCDEIWAHVANRWYIIQTTLPTRTVMFELSDILEDSKWVSTNGAQFNSIISLVKDIDSTLKPLATVK